jgi:hypothetical protein
VNYSATSRNWSLKFSPKPGEFIGDLKKQQRNFLNFYHRLFLTIFTKVWRYYTDGTLRFYWDGITGSKNFGFMRELFHFVGAILIIVNIMNTIIIFFSWEIWCPVKKSSISALLDATLRKPKSDLVWWKNQLSNDSHKDEKTLPVTSHFQSFRWEENEIVFRRVTDGTQKKNINKIR